MTAIIRIGIFLLSLALRLAIKLRLALPLFYTLLMVTVFSQWSAQHESQALIILAALLAASACSWLVSLVRKLRSMA